MKGSAISSKSRRRKRLQLELLEDRQLLATLTVNTAADETAADSTLSLREAIEVSNGTLAVSSLSTQEKALVSGAVGNTNTIDFNIPTSDPGYDSTTGVWTLALHSNLPTITKNAAVIDGYSQPGASKNTLAKGDNAKLVIALSSGGVGAYNGLVLDQPGTQVSGLDIENFSVDGVQITSTNVQVAGCFIGTTATGETAAPNGTGVEIDNSSNTLGGLNVGDRNVISASNGSGLGSGDGVYVPDQSHNPLKLAPTGNQIENSYIGLDATGTKTLPNNLGVQDNASGDIYGGTGAGVGNVISGNNFGGIRSDSSITIQGNLIGTDATGNIALGNGNSGEGIFDNQVNVGTITIVISGNVVSGNQTGIELITALGSQTFYTISNNLVGTNAAGTAALGNTAAGMYLVGVSNALIKGNVISANGTGVMFQYPEVQSQPAQNDVMQGNLIGTDKTGKLALGNKTDGIMIASGNGIEIGGSGAGQGNLIAYNGQDGINVQQGEQDQFTQNAIFGNKSTGIYLVWQGNQNATPPVLTFTPGSGNSGTLSGKLSWGANSTYVVEIYSNQTDPTTGKEQGATFVQDVSVTTDGTGKGSFSVTEPTGVYYTATATDSSGNSSVFSNAVGASSLPALPPTQTSVTTSLNPSTPGQTVTFTAIVTSSGYQGTPTGTVTFTIDGQAQTPVPLAVVGGNDEAQFTTSTLLAGAHSVTASYSGDTNVSPSSGSLPTQTVNAPTLPPTHTHVTTSLSPSTVGQAVTFTAVVSPTGTQGTPTGTVTFIIDGQQHAPVPLNVVGGVDEARFTISTLAAGDHAIKAFYSGDSTYAASGLVDPLVQVVKGSEPSGNPGPIDPPTVVDVNRFGIHMQPTVLVVTFSEALDPTSAQDPKNYKIFDPSGRPVGIASAVYDAAAHTVTIKPRNRINLHHTYRLTVYGSGQGGLTDAHGTRLDGVGNGLPGSDYTTTLTWRNVVWPPSLVGKYVHPKAAHPAGALGHHFLAKVR
jgi:hypothetical protein